MMRACRGLTLVEVMAALVLLAIVSSASWSFLRDIRFQMDSEAPSGTERAELGAAADATLKGEVLDAVLRLPSGETLSAVWPQIRTNPDASFSQPVRDTPSADSGSTHPVLHLRRLSVSTSAPPGLWLACTAGEDLTVVYRWIALVPVQSESNSELQDTEHRP